MSGRSRNIDGPVKALQNSAHGVLLAFGVALPISQPFCEITKDGCANLTPPCNATAAILPDQEFCYCSSLSVPSVAPDASV